METKHTPGPWEVDSNDFERGNYKTVVRMPLRFGQSHTSAEIARVEHNWKDAGAQERRISWAEAEANARLISAAPDLFAALRSQIVCTGNLARKLGFSEEDVSDMTAQSRAALAKTTGAA